jgi:hypothetical protein
MTKNQAAAFINSQVAIFQCRLEGMLAENRQRKVCGHSPAYTEEAFSELEAEFSSVIGHNAVMQTFFDSTDS